MSDTDIMKEYLLMKFRQADYHAVMDAAADLREMVARDEQRKAIESKRIERSLADISQLARASTKQSSPTDSPHLVAGSGTKESLSRELGAKADQTDWGAGIPGLNSCPCPVCETARAKGILLSSAKDFASIREELDQHQSIPATSSFQQTKPRTGRRDL